MKSFISFILVTYNSSDNIKTCLESIEKNCDIEHEITIIDNNSSDDTVEQIKGCKVRVNLKVQKQNLGFSRANNIGVEQSSGEYLFFLNPDTRILSSIKPLLEFYAKNSNVGIAAPKLINEKGVTQPSVRNLPTIKGAFLEYILKIKYIYDAYFPNIENPVEVESVVGAAILISKKNYRQVGGFDNKYFLYFEDIDLCRKVKRFGLKIFYIPNVKIQHSIGKSASSNPEVSNLLIKSAQIYHGKFIFMIIKLIMKVGRKV